MERQPEYKVTTCSLQQNAREIKTFNIAENLDIIVISESHFTDEKYLQISKYKVYYTKHPDDKAHDGTVITKRETSKHNKNEKVDENYPTNHYRHH